MVDELANHPRSGLIYDPKYQLIREEVWAPTPEDDDIPPQDRNPDLCQICGKFAELPVCASHYDAIQANNHQLNDQLGEIAKVTKWLRTHSDLGSRPKS